MRTFNKARRRQLLSYALIALIVSVIAIMIDSRIIPGKGTWNQLELRSLDVRFLFKTNPASDQIKKKIAVIAIDENSYRKINQPIIFYHTYLSRVIDDLVEGGAKTIGLDIEFPTISLEDRIQGGYESVYIKSLLRAKQRGTNVVIGFSSQENTPLQAYLFAAGNNNVAAFYLTDDSDAFIRRQQLFFEDHAKRYDSLSYLLAKDFTDHQLRAPAETILIDYSPIV